MLLFGSLARGRQAPESDIDLVAIFDDLDYPTRWARKSELQRLAGEAAGCDVDVRVTDWPEWAVRSKVVTTSFESRIARDAVVLWSGEPRGVNWDKEIGLPTTNEEEAAASLTNACEAVRREDPRHSGPLGSGRADPDGDHGPAAGNGQSAQTSSIRVTGPSLVSSTAMWAPKEPVATVAPRRRNSATSSSISRAASSGAAASMNDGRRPLRVSP